MKNKTLEFCLLACLMVAASVATAERSAAEDLTSDEVDLAVRTSSAEERHPAAHGSGEEHESKRRERAKQRNHQRPQKPHHQLKPPPQHQRTSAGDKRAALADFKRAALADFKRAALADFKRAALADFKRAALADFKRAALADFKRAALADFKRAALADFKRSQNHQRPSEQEMPVHLRKHAEHTESREHGGSEKLTKRVYYWDVCSRWVNGQEKLYVCKKRV